MQCLHFSLLCCNDWLGSCWLPAGLIELSALIDNNRNSIDNFCENRSMKNHNRFTPKFNASLPLESEIIELLWRV